MILHIFFIALCTFEALTVELPSFIRVCHKNDPNLNECLMASVEELRPYLVKGVSEYNIPSLEPLVMEELIKEEIAGMKITTYNVSAYGCSEFFVRELNVDIASHDYKMVIEIPKLRIEAHYSVDGRLLLLPIKGNGNMEANVTEIVANCDLRGELYEKDNENYLRFTSVDLRVKVGGGTVRLENLFNGDKILLGVINDVANKNFDGFLHEFVPVIERALEKVFLKIGNTIVESFTLDQLFPE